MFPIRDDNPTLHTSLATFAIIAANVASWIFIQGLGFNPGLIRSICEFGLIPGELLGTLEPGTRIPLGAGYAYVIEQNGKWYSIITSMFMHAEWLRKLRKCLPIPQAPCPWWELRERSAG